jgi:hypothetical protein
MTVQKSRTRVAGYVARMGYIKVIGFCRKTGRKHQGEKWVDGRIILKCILHKFI